MPRYSGYELRDRDGKVIELWKCDCGAWRLPDDRAPCDLCALTLKERRRLVRPTDPEKVPRCH